MSKIFILADDAERLSALAGRCNRRGVDAEVHLASIDGLEPTQDLDLRRSEIVILDHGDANVARAQLVDQIRKNNEPTRVLVTGIPDQPTPWRTELIFDYLEFGAAGYVTERNLYQLGAALDEVARGGAWIEPSMTTELVQRTIALRQALVAIKPQTFGAGQPDVLTRRQTEVLELLAAGQTNREIAETLYISVGTVKNHVHHILDALQASSRDQAAEYFHFMQAAAPVAA
jgi:DNA-binding NarL/FixJ family response regulator